MGQRHHLLTRSLRTHILWGCSMTEHESRAHSREAFFEAVHSVTELLSHEIGHGVNLVGNLGASEISALVATSVSLAQAASAGAKGDWDKAANHSADMANHSLNFLTGGLLGVGEAAADAALAASRIAGHDAPTVGDLRHDGLHAVGEKIGDFVFEHTHPLPPGMQWDPGHGVSSIHDGASFLDPSGHAGHTGDGTDHHGHANGHDTDQGQSAIDPSGHVHAGDHMHAGQDLSSQAAPMHDAASGVDFGHAADSAALHISH
jgi:hypothetical protein